MIDLLPDAEQQQIIDSAASYFEAGMPLARLRPSGPGPRVTPAQWAEIAGLGWFGMGVPEEKGGVGFTIAEELLIAHQIGRYVASPAIAGAMLAAHVAAHAGDEALLGRIMSGECRIGLAHALLPAAPGSTDGDYHLIDAGQAEALVLWTDEGAGLFAREAFQDVRSVPPFDASLELERGRLGGAAPLAWVSATKAKLPSLALLLMASQLAGISEAARDVAVEYAKIRHQFGQPIGSFQAIKHHCANMAVDAEAAIAQVAFAGLLLAGGAPDSDFQVSVAAVLAAQAALSNGRSGIQIHGGIGFTAECDAHWFLKRAHVLEQLVGVAATHRATLLAVEDAA